MDLSRSPTLRQPANRALSLLFSPSFEYFVYLDCIVVKVSTVRSMGPMETPAALATLSQLLAPSLRPSRGRSLSLSHLRQSKNLNWHLPQSYRVSRSVPPSAMGVNCAHAKGIVQAASRICECLVFGLGCSLGHLPCELENLGGIVEVFVLDMVAKRLGSSMSLNLNETALSRARHP